MPTSKQCQACGEESGASAKFCRSCGAELAEAAALSDSKQLQSDSTQPSLICPSCGAEPRPGAKFCRSCGAEVTEAATQSDSTQTSAPATDETAARCSSCGTETRDGAKFCRSCGASLTESAPTAGARGPARSPAKASPRGPGRRAFLIGGGVAAAIVVVVGIVAVVVGGDDDDATVSRGGGGQPGEISEIFVYSDPLDPLQSRVEFVASDELPLDAIEFFGSKDDGAGVPESALIYSADFEEPLSVHFDETGRPDQLQTPSGGALKLEYQGDTALVHFLAPDGRFGVESVLLNQEILDALEGIEAGAAAPRAAAAVEGRAALVSAAPVRAATAADNAALAPVSPPEGEAVAEYAPDFAQQLVRRSTRYDVLAVTEDGEDVTKAIGNVVVSSTGFQHASSNIERVAFPSGTVIIVNVVHLIPAEVIVQRVQDCGAFSWKIAGATVGLVILGVVLGPELLLAMGLATSIGQAQVLAYLGASLFGAIGLGISPPGDDCVQIQLSQLSTEYSGKFTTIDLCPTGEQIESFEPPCASGGTYAPFLGRERGSFRGDRVFTAKLKDDVGDLEDCSLGRTGSSRPPARSPRFVINAPRREDTSLLVPQREDQPQPFFAPPGYVTKCGPVVVEALTVEATGTFQPPLDPGSGVGANEITLSFPAEGGDVTGNWILVTTIDLRARGYDCRFTQTTSGLLEGSYDGSATLSGTTFLTGTISGVSGCEDDINVEDASGPVDWSARFDGQRVTGSLGAIPFTASVPTE